MVVNRRMLINCKIEVALADDRRLRKLRRALTTTSIIPPNLSPGEVEESVCRGDGAGSLFCRLLQYALVSAELALRRL